MIRRRTIFQPSWITRKIFQPFKSSISLRACFQRQSWTAPCPSAFFRWRMQLPTAQPHSPSFHLPLRHLAFLLLFHPVLTLQFRTHHLHDLKYSLHHLLLPTLHCLNRNWLKKGQKQMQNDGSEYYDPMYWQFDLTINISRAGSSARAGKAPNKRAKISTPEADNPPENLKRRSTRVKPAASGSTNKPVTKYKKSKLVNWPMIMGLSAEYWQPLNRWPGYALVW